MESSPRFPSSVSVLRFGAVFRFGGIEELRSYKNNTPEVQRCATRAMFDLSSETFFEIFRDFLRFFELIVAKMFIFFLHCFAF